MATCLDVISRGLRLIGVVSPSDAISGADVETGMSVLNDLLKSMGLFRALAAGPTEEVFALQPNVANYTIGVGQTFDTALPVQIDDSTFVRIGTIDYRLQMIDGEQWAAIPLKQVGSYVPDRLYFYRQADYGELRFYPTPGSGCDLHLRSWKPFSGYTSDSDELNLPAGYERLLGYVMAEELAPEYGREAPLSVQKKAAGARHQIKAVQLEVPNMQTLPASAGRFNIFTGRNG